MSTPTDTPGVVAPPPLIYLALILAAFVLKAIAPLPVIAPSFGVPLGVGLVVVSLVLFAASIREFKRTKTPVETRKPTTAIIRTGPYSKTRNPIYLSMTTLHLGIAFWVGSMWFFATLLVAVAVISTGVIAREERYLERSFGEEYLTYKKSVRRWL